MLGEITLDMFEYLTNILDTSIISI
jgi:hypothetical protein